MTSGEKIIVITGASAGIGAALAHALGAQKHTLVLAARRTRELDAVAAACGTRALAVVADVTKRADIEKIRDTAIRELGHVDVWVNNVGRGISRPALALTDADVDEMLTVNLKSALWGMQAIAPHFKERGAGHIVNVSSFLGRVPIAPIRSIYSASKAALNSLTANVRVDLAATHPGIDVSLVIPGIVATEFAENSLGAAPGQAPIRPTSGPMRAQTAEEVADVIAELIAKPRAEVYTNPAHRDLALRYYADVAEFEASVPTVGGPPARGL